MSIASPTVAVRMIQLDVPDGEPTESRIERISHLARAGRVPDLIVLPELWDVGYFAFDNYSAAGRSLEDGPVSGVRMLARELATTIVAGSVLERDGDRLHNTVAVVGPDGGLIGTYRKMHLFAYDSQESELLTPGSDVSVVDTPAGRLGLATCFDLRFPDQFAKMLELGTEIFVVPAAWPAARTEAWKILVRARAIETQTPVAACNGTGLCSGTLLAGSSLLVNARGDVVAEGGTETRAGAVDGMVDHTETREWRVEFPMQTEVPVA